MPSHQPAQRHLVSRHLLLASGLALLTACSGPAPAPQAGAALLHGHLALGPYGEAFLPCGASQPLQVVAAPAVGERLQAEYLDLVGEPHEEVFLRLRGRQLAAECTGCPPRLQVEQILELQAAAPGDCR
ncbi:hypothetical protein [Pseudomonas oryzae]|uniref:Lipoprotein n=1 Tax=Pseudomonas oryzae TaxID=1392877 RepID=A0A1H1UXA2_9PSED|nr:hypothetical protein [Pseudomonas oryzae]SDS77157.1 hypothetical protein SAMN05216221_2590 [Pseudomonas oryzae]